MIQVEVIILMCTIVTYLLVTAFNLLCKLCELQSMFLCQGPLMDMSKIV